MAELLKLLNRDRDMVAVIDHYTEFSYERRLSAATSWSVAVPLGDVKQSLLDVANYLVVERDGVETFTGKVTARTIGPETVSVSGYSEEIELERAITPAQYGLVFSNMDLAQVAEELTWARAVVRVKDKSQWDEAVEFVRVDSDSEPGLVILDKASSGQYYNTGGLTLRFDSTTIPGFTSWERIRWASDNDAPVSTTMQYRYGASLGALTSWSEAVPGVLTDEIGVIPAATTQRYLEVRINLATTDTETDGIGFSPALFALEVIAKTYQILSPDGTLGLTGETVSGLVADSESHLAVLQQACQQLGYEFVVREGVLYLAKTIETDRTSEFVLKGGSNVDIISLGDQDDQLVNSLTAYGPGTGINRMQVVLEDATSIAAYGRYPGVQQFSSAVDLAELTQKAQDWLDDHKGLEQSYEVHAAFDPEDEPIFSVGDKVKVVDPVSGVVADVRVMGITRSVSASESSLSLDLGTPAKNLVDAILDDLDPDRNVRLALAVPVGLRATPAAPGITVSVNPYVNSRSAGVEVHMAAVADFTPSAATVVGRGQATSYVITGLITGARYYFKARSYDDRGEYSAFTSEVSTLAGGVDIDDIGPIDMTKFASGIRPVRVGTALPVLPDPTNYLIGDGFALYSPTGGNPVLYLAQDTNDDGFADSWKAAVNAGDLEGLITGDQLLINTITAAQIAVGAITATELAADAVTAPKIAAGAVQAEHIAAGSIQAGHISVTDTSNLIGNPVFEIETELEGWENLDTRYALGSTTGLPASFAGGKRVSSSGHGRFYYGKPFPVSPGEAYYISSWIRKADNVPNSSIRMGLQFMNAGQTSSWYHAAFTVPHTTPSSWTMHDGTVTAPANATWARFYGDVPVTSPASGEWMFTKVVLRRAVDTRLLVDGTIEITNADKNNGALSVKDSNGVEQLRLGRIEGLPGVPSGIGRGLWGRYGVGVFIQGVNRVLTQATAGDIYEGSQLTHPGTRTAGLTIPYDPKLRSWSSNLTLPYTIPSGRAVSPAAYVAGYSIEDSAFGQNGGSAHCLLTRVDCYTEIKTSSSGSWQRWNARRIAGTTIHDVRVQVAFRFSTIGRTIFNPRVAVDVAFQLVEFDI